ncbi:MADF domain [Cinara cedri]|uniref:MADF domain n=1 Tax=Cinara cedri TaxID=506608 RepID=A0A5E4MZR2_9HEMI|nr:MADF domain [Cinara cedri]
METEIDTLINEIEKRPVIWDMTTHEYSNRTIKRSWEELMLVFGGPEYSEEKKKNLGLELQKRWKGIQNAYPTIKRNSTENSFETADVGGDDNLESSIENPIEEDSSRAQNEKGTFKSPFQQRKKIKLSSDEHFTNIIEKSLNHRIL